VEISRELTRYLLFLRLEKIDRNGLIALKRKHVYHLNYLRNAFSQADVDWYLNLMKDYIPYSSSEDVYWMPFFTIKLLQLAVFKWSGLPQIGKELNYIGKTVEEIIFNLVQSFETQTTHPITGKPLLRVVDPDTGEEIADVMMYNDKFIIIIESKFWDCPLLATLENEITRFKEKINLFKVRQSNWGFPKAEVIPIFYTPFAPHATWQDIQLISSRFLLAMYISKFFDRKKPKLIDKFEQLKQHVLSEDYPFPYPIDAHEFNNNIGLNTYRIQDGLVVSYNEQEVDVEILNPLGQSFVVTFEISKDTFEELKKEGITSGTLIRMGTVNLSGSWSITQMLYFQKIDATDSKRKIREIWGNTHVAEDIVRVFQKWNLDIFRFIEFCKARAPLKEYWPFELAARMGTVLFLDESSDFVGQCPCGQIMRFSRELLELRKKMGSGRILCLSCLGALQAS
jgi:hypothetical protein